MVRYVIEILDSQEGPVVGLYGGRKTRKPADGFANYDLKVVESLDGAQFFYDPAGAASQAQSLNDAFPEQQFRATKTDAISIGR